MTPADALAAAPLLVLVGGACAIVLLDLSSLPGPRLMAGLGAAVALAAGAAAAVLGTGAPGFGGALLRDGGALAFTLVIAVATAMSLALAGGYLAREAVPGGEFVALVLLSAAGGVLMAVGGDLVVIFLGLELLSLPLYVLTALLPRAARGDEGALKYFLLGAATSAVLLYGIALVYAATGHYELAALRAVSPAGSGVPATGLAVRPDPSILPGGPLILAGLAFIVAGLAFKAALVPFHAWAPDVYESAPTPATAFMAVVAKAGAFGALLRIVASTTGSAIDWQVSLAALAALTLILASFAAVGQRRVKRLLAYSSIAHAGFLTMGSATGIFAAPAVVFYLAIYGALTVGSFGVIALLDNDDPTIGDLAGLWRQRPVLVLALGVFLVGLTGLPPTGGFLAKLYVFEAAIRSQLLWLVVIGVLASVVSAAYYFRVLLACFQPGDASASLRPAPRLGTVVVSVAALAVLAAGVVPGPLLDLAQHATY